MLHEIKPERHGPLGTAMADAVSRCVHCGFCLAACPTYRELGQEMDSPRGRIVLMKQVLEGQLPAAAAQPHIDRCLGCLACEPACPSGVPYRDLISPYRATVGAAEHTRGSGAALRRWLAAAFLPRPAAFRAAARAGLLARRFLPWTPTALRPLLRLLPESLPAAVALPAFTPAQGTRRARVALLAGCAQQVLDPDINVATIAVLSRNGIEVVVPRAQGCCGGLAWHTGDHPAAQSLARRNLAAFPGDVDAIVTNAAGCGSALHEYGLILRGAPEAEQAEAFQKRVVDVSVLLDRVGLIPPTRRRPLRVAYQDACHLANAQGVRQPPRRLLEAIPGVEVLELEGSDQCCGSAGTYNLDQPEIAAALGRRKAEAVRASGAEVVASGNIGCLTQLQHHLKALGADIPARHTLQILRDAYAE